MGLLGSAMGRALGGIGSAAVDLGNKYIDQNLALQRAQVLADIQRASAVQQVKDIDTYSNSPERRRSLRELATEDTLASERAKTTAALETATNEPLQAAAARNAGRVKRAESENTAHNTSPGGEVIIGAGKNTRATPQEVQDRLYRDQLKGTTKIDQMSESGKAQLKGVEERAKEIEKLVDKGLADGTLSTEANTPDGKPNPSYRQYQDLLRRQQDNGLQRMRILAREGVIDGQEDAIEAVADTRNPEQLEQYRKQAKMIGGEYAKAYDRVITEAMRQLAAPDNKAAAIAADAAATGTKDYTTDIGGVKGSVGNPPQAPAKPAGLFSRITQPQPEVTPPDSPSGRSMARQAQLRAGEAAGEAAKRQQAASAFAAINNDPAAAAQLQAGPLFSYLTPEQKRQVFAIVNSAKP